MLGRQARVASAAGCRVETPWPRLPRRLGAAIVGADPRIVVAEGTRGAVTSCTRNLGGQCGADDGGARRDSVCCDNTSGGFLRPPIEEVVDRPPESVSRGIGGRRGHAVPEGDGPRRCANQQPAPPVAMEIQAGDLPARAGGVEHFAWLDPLFDENLEIADGRLHLSARPGLGVTISEQARAWTAASDEVRV